MNDVGLLMIKILPQKQAGLLDRSIKFNEERWM